MFLVADHSGLASRGVSGLHLHGGLAALRPYRRLPAPWSALVVSLADPGSWRPPGQRDWRPFPRVALCTCTTAYSEALDGVPGEYLRAIVLVEPWALRDLLGLDPSAVHDRVLDLSATRPALCAELLSAARELDPEPVLRRIGDALARLPRPRLDPKLQAFWRASRDGGGAGRVADMADAEEMSERDLRSRVRRQIGVSPKRWLRVQRLASRLRELHPCAWTGPSLPPDFFDQAHEIHEFRAMIGVTPDAYRRMKAAGDRRMFAYDVPC